jgi:DNA-binding NarL/FixJ family response regulator
MDAVNDARKPISILIAVAVRLYRDGLAMTLSAHPSLNVVGAFGTSHDSLAAVSTSQPDVVIVDAFLDDALALMRAIREESHRSAVLAFAVREDIAAVLECAEAGADGFFTANGSVQELVEAIERTAAGELLCSPRLAAQLLRRAAHHAQRPGEPAAGHKLTGREQQVLSLVRLGKSNKEIAAALNLSEATVKNHVHHVLEKLQVSTRAQAMAFRAQPLKVALELDLSPRRAS